MKKLIFIISMFSALLMISCITELKGHLNPLDPDYEGKDTNTAENTSTNLNNNNSNDSDFEVSPRNFSFLLATPPGEFNKITVDFGTTMETSSLSLTGDLIKTGVTPVKKWDDGEEVLTISGEWNVGGFKKITIDAEGKNGSQALIVLHYKTVAVVKYVSAGASGDGSSPLSPLGTIQAGLDACTADSAVVASAGTYSTAAGSAANFVAAHEGIGLYGGYSADFKERDTGTHETILSTSGNITVQFNLIDAGTATVIDGFTITCTGSYTTVIASSSASPIIQACRIFGNDDGYAIQTRAQTIIRNNIISGDMNHTGYTYGINVNGGNPLIYNNVISGGTGEAGSYAIYLSNGSSPNGKIYNNTLKSEGSNLKQWVISISQVTYDISPAIVNNIISGNDAANTKGIYIEFSAGYEPDPITNNNFYNCATEYSIRGLLPAENNVHMDVAGFPEEVFKGGLDGSAEGFGFDYDFNWKPRTGNGTTGWSMGAYEVDGE